MIRLKKVDKRFNGNHVLNSLDLDIHDGEILVIVGKSGSGKSVLLKHIMGLFKPNSGEVLVDNHDMTKLEGKKLYDVLTSFGMIFQGCALFDSLTIGENVGFYMEQHGMRGGAKFDRSGIKKVVEEALKSVGLEGKADLYPSDLSGGMRKRAAIARSVCYLPQYLLYDEPTTGLDPVTAKTIGDLIYEEHQRLKGTTIVVSHDIFTTVNIADRIALIEDGRIEVVAPPEEFMRQNHPTIRMFNQVIGGDISKVREKK
jgi:phospholipid/cholesterol/gamma-HCH transport system ATP-binding protein